jgi:hypothetical protein
VKSAGNGNVLESTRPRGNPPGRIIYPINGPYYYNPVFFYPGFGFYGGGFGLGYGFGYGLGYGAFGCDPFSIWGCDPFGYNNYYSPYYGFGATDGPGFVPGNNQQDTPATPSQFTAPYSYEPPPGPQTPPDAQQSGATNDQGEQAEAVVYLKDGSDYLLRNYWVAGGQLHYQTADGVEHVADMKDVDLQKTVDVNASRGVTFTLRPATDSPANAPTDASPDSTQTPPPNSSPTLEVPATNR